jgi:hypothetical protein
VRAQHDAVIGADELTRSPEWLPLGAAGGSAESAAVRLVRLDEAAYRAASFLDQRLLASGREAQSCTPATLELAASRLVPRAHYIFHVGHVGSTLISRLIGAHPGFFALREPALLRELAAGGALSERLPLRAAQALLSRTWRPSQRAVVKVTSFVSELAASMLAAPERPAAIFVHARPLTYLRTILAGPNSRLENRELAPLRLRRLARRFEERDWRPEPRSEGELIAMSWLCEMSALRAAAARFPSQVRWVEFDAFLSQPARGLEAVFRALGEEPAARDVEQLVAGPLMRQYSKAPEHAYDAALRRQVLDSAEREHAAELRAGMEWLAAAGARDPTLLAPP